MIVSHHDRAAGRTPSQTDPAFCTEIIVRNDFGEVIAVLSQREETLISINRIGDEGFEALCKRLNVGSPPAEKPVR